MVVGMIGREGGGEGGREKVSVCVYHVLGEGGRREREKQTM